MIKIRDTENDSLVSHDSIDDSKSRDRFKPGQLKKI